MKIIVANWKMNGNSQFAANYVAEIMAKLGKPAPNAEVVVCPPAPLLSANFAPFKKGGQNCFIKERGAYTGEISAEIMRDTGCEYVIVGHSERRYLGETSEQTSAKATCAHKAGLKAIICVGENKGEDRNKVVSEQLKASVPFSANEQNTIIAYEPVWAIGTGQTPNANDIEEAHQFIKSLKPLPVLYGGSVKAENAAEFLALKSVDGLLVGGASLDITEFAEIIGAAK